MNKKAVKLPLTNNRNLNQAALGGGTISSP